MAKLKPGAEKSEVLLQVRLTRTQMTRLNEIAERLGLSRSSAVKYLIMSAEGWGTTTPTHRGSVISKHDLDD